MVKRHVSLGFAVSLGMFSNIAVADGINNLLIEGDDTLPGIVGSYEPTALYSWMENIFPLNTTGHSWILGPGTHGGILLGRVQNPGELTSFRPVYNQLSSFFSVSNGITIDDNDNIDMANLRWQTPDTVIDVGSGSGYNTVVPRVDSLETLLPDASGWLLNPDGTYHILYRTRGSCDGCKLVLHFYGVHVPSNGDINADGNVNAADLYLSQQAYLGNVSLDLNQRLRADVAPIVNGKAEPDGNFDIPDVIAIHRKALGKINF